jgi:uncharacterized repeat protein (TIGR01451 family)
MTRKRGFGLLMFTLCFTLLFSVGQVAWADVLIDSFATDQDALQIVARAPFTEETVSNTASGAGIVGGTRLIVLTIKSGNEDRAVNTIVNNGEFANGNDDTANSEVKLIYSGDGTEGNFGLTENLCLGDRFVFDVNFDDLAVDVDIEVYSGPGQVSVATLSLPGQITSPQVFEVPFSAFSAGADFCDVKEIRVIWTGQDALDFRIDQINVPEEAEFQCDFKFFDGVSRLVLDEDTTFPTTIQAEVSITNSGGVPLLLNIVDTLDAGLSYVANTVTPISGPDPGEPNVNAQQLSWQVLVPDGVTLRFTYDIEVAALGDGDSLSNSVVVTADGLQLPPSNCSATVTFQIRPPEVPFLAGWWISVGVFLFSVVGIYLQRRRKQSL